MTKHEGRIRNRRITVKVTEGAYISLAGIAIQKKVPISETIRQAVSGYVLDCQQTQKRAEVPVVNVDEEKFQDTTSVNYYQ